MDGFRNGVQRNECEESVVMYDGSRGGGHDLQERVDSSKLTYISGKVDRYKRLMQSG
jgi:hypothetical protein